MILKLNNPDNHQHQHSPNTSTNNNNHAKDDAAEQVGSSSSSTAFRSKSLAAQSQQSSSFYPLVLIVLLLFCFRSVTAAVGAASSSSSLLAGTTKTGRRNNSHGSLKNEASNTNNTNNNNTNNNAWLNGLKNAVCSAGAAACSKTILQPVDAIKTIQQNYKGQHALSIWGACQEIGSLGNFYSGLTVNVLGSMPGVALYFGVYSYTKQRLLATQYGKEHKTSCIALAAAIGNTIASCSRVPYEVLKQQLQTGHYSSTLEALQFVGKECLGGNFASIFPKGGIAIQMIRDVPYAVVTLLCYESLQSYYNTHYRSTCTPEQNKAADFLLGGTAGGIGSYVTNPMDVLKTRIQTNSALYHGSVVQCFTDTWQEGGAMAFLRGSVPRLVHKVPANAFFFFFYEVFRTVLRVEDNNEQQQPPVSKQIQKNK